ncbi:MAG: glycosyltransferase family 4 protein, partial [Clostridiales bacterium]|nr:glycosyltransferase family 4 protein [Clostridiales bacterium]
MHIVYIDTVIFDLQHAGGISVYWYEIIKRMLADESVDPYFLVSDTPKNNLYWDKLTLPENKIVRCNTNRYRAVNYKEQRDHVFISSYYRYSVNKNAYNVTVVHDFTYELYAHGLRKWVHHWQKSKAVKKSQQVICISQNTQKDMHRFCKCKCPSSVVYNGVSDAYKVLTEEELKERLIAFQNSERDIIENKPFVLWVGGRAGYKNWKSGVALFKTLPQEYYMISVGGGKPTDEEKQLLGEWENRHIWLSAVDEDKLCVLYNKAYCLLYLSEYEGFGLPVAEAQQCGCPVVALNRSSLPEIAVNSCLVHLFVDTPAVLPILQHDISEYRFCWEQTYAGIKKFLKLGEDI